MGHILSKQDTHIQLGVIQGVFGIKGWLKIFSFCRPKEQILDYPAWELRSSVKGNKQTVDHFTLQEGKPHGSGIVARLGNINDRNQAELWVRSEIWVAKNDLPNLQGDEFYWFQLEGLAVMNIAGESFGQVIRMMETGANDVMVVKSNVDEAEILIPYIRKQVIKHVDLEAKTITVDWQKDY
jgi:16S rRNA processing protein RimM